MINIQEGILATFSTQPASIRSSERRIEPHAADVGLAKVGVNEGSFFDVCSVAVVVFVIRVDNDCVTLDPNEKDDADERL